MVLVSLHSCLIVLYLKRYKTALETLSLKFWPLPHSPDSRYLRLRPQTRVTIHVAKGLVSPERLVMYSVFLWCSQDLRNSIGTNDATIHKFR